MSNARKISKKLNANLSDFKNNPQVRNVNPELIKIYKDHENPAELTKVITKQMRQELGDVLDEADKQHQYIPY